MGIQRVISAEQGTDLPRAEFPAFERRPANYYRDQFADEESDVVPHESGKEAEAEIARAVAEERERCERTHHEALTKQYEAGREQGRQEATVELARGLELLSEYAKLLQAEKSEIAARAEQHSLELAFALARKIVGEELAARPEAFLAVVGKALQQVLGSDKIKLRVHPDDLDYLKTVQTDLEKRLSSDVEFTLRPDEKVERGGCLIETEQGMLDAQIGSQLATLRSGLEASSETNP